MFNSLEILSILQTKPSWLKPDLSVKKVYGFLNNLSMDPSNANSYKNLKTFPRQDPATVSFEEAYSAFLYGSKARRRNFRENFRTENFHRSYGLQSVRPCLRTASCQSDAGLRSSTKAPSSAVGRTRVRPADQPRQRD